MQLGKFLQEVFALLHQQGEGCNSCVCSEGWSVLSGGWGMPMGSSAAIKFCGDGLERYGLTL